MQVRRLAFVAGVVLAGAGLSACGTPANDFEAGECTDDSLTGAVGDIDTVDCDESHQAEAIAQFDIDGDDFPGAAEIQTEGDEGCQGDRFEDYVGISYAESIYLVGAIVPSEGSWDGGDRTVICVIGGTTDGSELEGSAEGSNE
jgi:hypothetical protein